MAKLVKCKDCGFNFSKSAKACPQCGKPQRRTSGCAWLALILILSFIGMAVIGNLVKNDSPHQTPKTTLRHEQQQQEFRKVANFIADYAPLQEKLQGFNNYGWFVKPCNESLCGKPSGYLVAFRAKTSIGAVVPIWFVSKKMDERGWVNGKASGFTPDLPQASVPDIAAIFELFKKMPVSSAVAM